MRTLALLRGFAEFHSGIPCADWLRGILNCIDPDPFMDRQLWWSEPDNLPVQQASRILVVIKLKNRESARHRGADGNAAARRRGDRRNRVGSFGCGSQACNPTPWRMSLVGRGLPLRLRSAARPVYPDELPT